MHEGKIERSISIRALDTDRCDQGSKMGSPLRLAMHPFRPIRNVLIDPLIR